MIAPAKVLTIHIETLNACPICGGAFSGERVHGNGMYYEFGGVDMDWYYGVCGSCGVLALNPRMSEEYTREYYTGKYRNEMRPLGIKTEFTARMRALTQVALVGHLLTGSTALDVGCSRGYLMRELEERGFTCTGVDPDPDSVAAYADLAQVPFQAFDVITCSHTLEHINYPAEFLKTLRLNYAHSATRLMIDVPNYPTGTEGGLYQPHHPFVFGLDSLTRLLELTGWRVVFSALHADGEDAKDNLLVVAEVS